MARGNHVAYSFGTQDAELHFVRLYVPRTSLGTAEVMEFRGPNYDENYERQFLAKGYARGEGPGDPKAPVCVHPSECEGEYVGCQVRHYLLANGSILDWLTYWILTIEPLAVVAEGGMVIADEPNPRGLIVSVFLTKI